MAAFKFTYLQYINQVSNSKIPTCKMVKLAVKRHVADMKASEAGTFPYIFDQKRAQSAIIFFSHKRKACGAEIEAGTMAAVYYCHALRMEAER
jgi:phage terminase large subunit-like protein